MTAEIYNLPPEMESALERLLAEKRRREKNGRITYDCAFEDADNLSEFSEQGKDLSQLMAWALEAVAKGGEELEGCRLVVSTVYKNVGETVATYNVRAGRLIPATAQEPATAACRLS